ncbi:MAG: D-alanyl-D-alanine carboxypeptidase/D-alanyl-D-alanine-endopeptidase [Ferruginibacter sp.]
MRTFCLFSFLLICQFAFSQDIKAKLGAAITKLEGDEQFKHAIISMYVVDGKTGKVLYDKNGQVGLAPASCQKVVTSVSAFEMLGKDYRYKTDVGYFKQDYDITGLYFIGRGDPTLGSFRFASTRESIFMEQLKNELVKAGIKSIDHTIAIGDSIFSPQPIPDGWVWQDIGNYFGAGADAINWRENQYTIILDAGKAEGDSTTIRGFEPSYAKIDFDNRCKTGPRKSGDQSYVYFSSNPNQGLILGTIPLGENNFKVSAAVRAPHDYFRSAIFDYLDKNRFVNLVGSDLWENNYKETFLYTYLSPPLDSINYWFLKKSINLYGEAFVKTIAYQKTKIGSTDSGVNVIRNFWVDKGIERSALKIIDGSGLSPANRLTTNALVTVLQYAKQRPWFSSFYNALPEMNGIKMKDGYIGGVRSYTGYVKSASGAEYSFSFIVNNFDGSPASAREKIWKVLDLLK